jgi:hypothetical protein
MTLTPRDLTILTMPVRQVRLVGEDQILDAFWPRTRSGRTNGRRRLCQFCKARLLAKGIVHAKSVRRVALLFAGRPEGPWPDCALLSRQSKAAWSALPIRPQLVYTATRRARHIFGGLDRHRVHALPQVSHDLGCTASYLHLVTTAPELASQWRSEDEQLLPSGFGDAQPDAVLVDSGGRPMTAIEFGADYGPERYERLIRTFAEQGLDYRIYGAAP